MMRRTLFALACVLVCSSFAPAEEEAPAVDHVVLADRTVRAGSILSLDATDLVLREERRGGPRMIPLAEVREIRFRNGEVRLYSPIEDPDPKAAAEESKLRSSPFIRPEDLVLTRSEVMLNALPRGILAGTVATFFTTDGDQKRIAFGAGFLLQFAVSAALGW
jgi:hypothetical protein